MPSPRPPGGGQSEGVNVLCSPSIPWTLSSVFHIQLQRKENCGSYLALPHSIIEAHFNDCQHTRGKTGSPWTLEFASDNWRPGHQITLPARHIPPTPALRPRSSLAPLKRWVEKLILPIPASGMGAPSPAGCGSKHGDGGWGQAVRPLVPLRVETHLLVLPAQSAFHLGVSDTPTPPSWHTQKNSWVPWHCPLRGYLFGKRKRLNFLASLVTPSERGWRDGLDVGTCGRQKASGCLVTYRPITAQSVILETFLPFALPSLI